MFTPKVIDQFMGVVNHRSCSKASDPLEAGLICRVDGGGSTRPQNAVVIKYRIDSTSRFY